MKDSLGDYLNEIGRTPLLTPKQEIILSRQIRAYIDWPEGRDAAPPDVQRRGLRARNKMVQANLRLAVMVANKYQLAAARRGLSLQDVIQEASIGLVRGAEKYDGSRGYKASTYLFLWARQGVTRAISGGGVIKIASQVRLECGRISKAVRDLGEGASFAEIAAEAGLTTERAAEVLRLQDVGNVSSLDKPLTPHNGDANSSLGELLPDPNSEHDLSAIDMEDVVSFLRGMDPDALATVELVALDGLTRKGLAAVEGCTTHRATVLLHQARSKLAALAPAARELLVA